MPATIQRPPGRRNKRYTFFRLFAVVFALTALVLAGCATQPRTLGIKDHPKRLREGAILETDPLTEISFEALIEGLREAHVVYVGESHTNPAHHAIQLSVIKAFTGEGPDLAIGMEMFDQTYQTVLDRWTAGELSEKEFMEQTHWYANWRYDFDLYRDILLYAKENRIRIIALNVPFHIPGKISVGGIASLMEADRRHLPAIIDTGIADHRAYVKAIFDRHRVRGRTQFAYFYEAQCTWEDTMAEAIARQPGTAKMVVLVGNGHIIRKFGVPNRAFKRNKRPFRTIYTVSVGEEEADPAWGDYLWVTAQTPLPRMVHAKR